MFSIRKRVVNKQERKTIFEQPFLDNNELNVLRALAEQLDCSSAPAHILDSRQAGNLATRALGSGIDYAESRVYQAGDDPRSINWRLSARSTETFVKTFHIESRPSISILLDRRRSMIFGTRSRLKITQALRTAALLGFASELHHLAFQGWIIDDSEVTYTDDFSAFLLKANKPHFIDKQETKTSLNAALQEVMQRTPKGSLVYVLSDFSQIDKAFQSNLAKLNEESFVQAIHIIDIAEIDLPSTGKLRLQDLKHNSSYQINTKNKKEQQIFSQQAATNLEHIKKTIRNTGAAYKQLLGSEDNIHTQLVLPLGQP